MSDKPQRSKERSCFGCNMCCVHLEIESKPGHSTLPDTGEDIAKPAGVKCRYSTDSGCLIYERRPPVCRGFRCDWLQGRKGFGLEDSPANTGVIGVRGVGFFFAPDRLPVPLPPDEGEGQRMRRAEAGRGSRRRVS